MENFNKNHLNRLINLCSEKDSEELAVIGGRAKEFISQNLHHLSDEEHADHAAAWREMSGGAPYPVDLNYYGGDERTILTAMGVAFLLWLAWRYASYTRRGSPASTTTTSRRSTTTSSRRATATVTTPLDGPPLADGPRQPADQPPRPADQPPRPEGPPRQLDGPPPAAADQPPRPQIRVSDSVMTKSKHLNAKNEYRKKYASGLVTNKTFGGNLPIAVELDELHNNIDLISARLDNEQKLLTYRICLDKFINLCESHITTLYCEDKLNHGTPNQTVFYFNISCDFICDVILIMKPFFYNGYINEVQKNIKTEEDSNGLWIYSIFNNSIPIDEVLCIIMPGGLDASIYNKVYDKFKVNIYNKLPINQYIESVHDVENDDIYTTYNVNSTKSQPDQKPYTKINLTDDARDYIRKIYKHRLLENGLISVNAVPSFTIENSDETLKNIIMPMFKRYGFYSSESVKYMFLKDLEPDFGTMNVWVVTLTLINNGHLIYLLTIIISIFRRKPHRITISKDFDFTDIYIHFILPKESLYEIKCDIDFILKYADSSIFNTKQLYVNSARYGNYVHYTHCGIHEMSEKEIDTEYYIVKGFRDPFTYRIANN